MDNIKIAAFPEMVTIRTNSNCNLSCYYCLRKVVDKDRILNKEMPWDIFKKIIDETSLHKSHIRCINHGEPMMHSDFSRQINYIKNSTIASFSINSNGYFLDKNISEILLEKSNVPIILEISLDALFEKTYQKVRIGSDYIKVLNNIFSFLEMRKKSKESNIKLVVSFVDHPLNREDIDQFKQFWHGLVDKVIIRTYNDWNGKLDEKSDHFQRGRHDEYICSIPFTRIAIGYSGEFYYCIDDWGHEYPLKNINDISISEVWKSEKYNEIRNYLTHNKQPTSTKIRCSDCTIRHLWATANSYVDLTEELI